MRTLFISMVLTPGGSSGPPAMLMPGWFAPIVGARSALRLSLSYCAWNKRRALCYRTATCFADKFQTFSFWYSLSLSLEDSWRSLFLRLSKSKSRSRSARSKGCLNHRCRSQGLSKILPDNLPLSRLISLSAEIACQGKEIVPCLVWRETIPSLTRFSSCFCSCAFLSLTLRTTAC